MYSMAGKNLTEFGNSLQIHQKFIHLVASDKSLGLGLNLPKFFLPNAI